MQPALESNVDYAVQATAALSAVERLTADLDAVAIKVTQCREKWRDYGAALLAQRALMPNNNEFGAWVAAHQLDRGLATDHSVRSHAMWFAEHFDVVTSCHNVTAYNPAAIRRQCREAGYEWAHETTLQRQRKMESVRAQRRATAYSWTRVAADEGVLVYTNGTYRTEVRKALQAIDPAPGLFGASGEARLRAALVEYRAQRQPEAATRIVSEAREAVPETMRVRFDKALARVTAALEGAYNAKANALQTSYEAAVRRGIEERLAVDLAEERKQLAESLARTRRELQEFKLRRDGIKLAISVAEWRLLRSVTHTDRASYVTADQLNQANAIVTRLKTYVGADS